jgi:LPS-assembly protein
MRVGREGVGAGFMGLVLMLAAVRAAEQAEVRVLSEPGPQPASTVTLRVRPDVAIEDRTPGARRAARPRGPASVGETFTGELTLFLPDFVVSRPASIEVADPVVSAVRLYPEAGGTTVAVFVRQPVTYTVARPSAIGEIAITLRSRTRPVTIGGRAAGGRPRVVRPKLAGEPEVAVDAESLSYDQQTDTLTARGGVTLTRGDTVLTADEVIYDRANGVAEARGHVVLMDPQATVTGDFAHINLEDESGWVDSGTANLLPSRYSMRADRIEKLGGPLYRVDDGVFTTCECGGLERPSWSVAGRRTDVKLSGAGVVRGATFRVKDVPVLWLPYLPFPANTDRQSGFLIPRVGYSQSRGFQYEQPFYWAINKSSDATFALDVETSARLGVIGEYRYRLSGNGRGAFTAGYFNETIRGRETDVQTTEPTPPDIPENRFGIAGYHRQPILGRNRAYLDLFAVSDDNFLREIDTFAFSPAHDLVLRSTRYTTSDVGLIRPWAGGAAWIDNAYYQDLVDPQSLALQRLPRIQAEHAMPLLGDGLVGRIAGEAIYYERAQGLQGLRGYLAPELFLPVRLGRFLHGSLSGQLSETAYRLTDETQVALAVTSPTTSDFRTAPELPRLEQNHTRELGMVRGRLGSQVERVFQFRHLGLEKVKHTIEPELHYLFVPESGRQLFELPDCSTLPAGRQRPGVNCVSGQTLLADAYLFDEWDAINRRNLLSWGLTTRVLGRSATRAEAEAQASVAEEGEEAVPPPTAPPPRRGGGRAALPRELVRVSLLQGYDVKRELVGTSHLSDVDAVLRLAPTNWLTLRYDTTFNLEDRNLRALSTDLVVREPRWTAPSPVRNLQSPTTVGVGYRFIEENINREVQPDSVEARLFETPGVNEILGSVYLRMGSFAGLAFLARYDLTTTPQVGQPPLGPHFLERDYFLRLISRCNCWLFEVGVTERINPKEDPLVRAQLTLVGLGSIGQGGIGRNFVGFGSVPSAPGFARAAGGFY